GCQRHQARAFYTRYRPFGRFSDIDEVEVVSARDSRSKLGGGYLSNHPCSIAGIGTCGWFGARDVIVVGCTVVEAPNRPAARCRLAAGGTRGVAADGNRAKCHAECFDQEQTSHERITDAQNQLERLHRLDGSDQSGQHAKHSRFGAIWNEAGGRRITEEAAVARSVMRAEDRSLALEAKDAPERVRLAEQYRGVVGQIARCEVVSSIDDDVEVA